MRAGELARQLELHPNAEVLIADLFGEGRVATCDFDARHTMPETLDVEVVEVYGRSARLHIRLAGEDQGFFCGFKAAPITEGTYWNFELTSADQLAEEIKSLVESEAHLEVLVPCAKCLNACKGRVGVVKNAFVIKNKEAAE